MTEARRGQWMERLRRLRDAEHAMACIGKHEAADRALFIRRAAQGQYLREGAVR